MVSNITKANGILGWMHRQCVINRTTCPCINGVRSDELLMYLKRYHSDLTDWINDLSNDPEKREYVWIETGLLEQLVEIYLSVKVRWNSDINKYEAVNP